tara:strand:+ start:296 stop:589 length:294 start_codon:yes stop_codon:yes gene_type:complete
MQYNNKLDRLKIVLNIISKLKNYETKDGTIINLYNENLCSFITKFKEITKKYIKQQDDNIQEYKGILLFEEINKEIKYLLPAKKSIEPLFVIKANKK